MPTIIERVMKANEIIKTTDHKCIADEMVKYLDELREYQVGLIQNVKDGKEFAFDELVQVKDITNFIYHYAWHIRKFYRFQYREIDVVSEIKFQIYYMIQKNYRIYNQPNEISLLIHSMRRWIKQKVGNELQDVYKPKRDEFLPVLFIEDESYDYSEAWVREAIDKILTPEDRKVFELRFFEGKGYKQIGQELGKSKDAINRRYEKILRQIKGYVEGNKGSWYK
ncbi:hypothetical protein [Microcystis phage MaeS]|nr:hypothetical protein [Microcystis phage MaeS]